MAKPLKKTKKVSASSMSCLPDEIVLDCLVRVPRRDYENVSCVSKRLRSLVRSPELHQMRSRLHKDPVYICIWERDNYSTDPTYLWFTLRQTTATEYQLVPIQFPSGYFMFSSSTVAVDSEIYFVGGHPKPTELWILDTRSGEFRQGPIMRQPRSVAAKSAVGVVDGKMYVTQELKNGSIEEEVFDLESQTWQDAGVPDEKVGTIPMVQSSVTLDGKVYAMNNGSITVTNLRRGRRKEKLEMPIVYRLRQGKKMATNDRVWCICVADYKLFAFFTDCGLMWLDTKHNIWRVVSGDMPRKLYGGAMVEYYGKLAVFWRERISNQKQEKIRCAVIALARVGEEEVRGTIEWSGVVATIPYVCGFLHCLVASD